jgi:hypothetical protein
VDYFLIFVGLSLSLYLNQISGPRPEPRSDVPASIGLYIVPLLPALLYLPQGIILLWPLFYGTQWLAGRPQALTAVEWLWGVAWLGTLLLTIWALWRHLGTPPAFADNLAYPPQSIWTVIVVPIISAAALVVGLIGLIGRWQQPWTHTFGIVLMVWPVLPLAGLLLWTEPHWKWLPLGK